MNKRFIPLLCWFALFCGAQQFYFRSLLAEREAELAAQCARAEKSEDDVAALKAAAETRETQLFALQGFAEQCEEARAQEAANAAIRRDITGPAREEQRQAQGGIASPHILTEGKSAHESARRAVADRLNRPL